MDPRKIYMYLTENQDFWEKMQARQILREDTEWIVKSVKARYFGRDWKLFLWFMISPPKEEFF